MIQVKTEQETPTLLRVRVTNSAGETIQIFIGCREAGVEIGINNRVEHFETQDIRFASAFDT